MINLLNIDCMEFMATCKDKEFDLAIVDPPYGIGKDGQIKTTGGNGGRKAYEFKGWDSETPDEKYFNELFRVSKNQIIWGGNYMTPYLPPSMGWIFWDKGQRINQSDGELAFTSFQQALRVVEYNRVELLIEGTIHPTQKPVKLYRWLLQNYATCKYCKNEGSYYEDVVGDGGSQMLMHCEECDCAEHPPKILDTHLGSGSSAIAAHQMGFSLTGCEIDKEYYEAAQKRFKLVTSQTVLF